MNCCICGPVRNCGPYLKKVLQNIEKIGSLFDDYKIVIYYDKSTDNSLAILKEYQKTNPRLHLYVNQNRISQFRTHNLAIASNFCLNFVRNNKDLFPYFIMMDFDDVNCKEVDVNVLEKYIKRENNGWDALSFNTTPEYYDIWALRSPEMGVDFDCLDMLSRKKMFLLGSRGFLNQYDCYVTRFQKHIPRNANWIQCQSAFGGMALYKTASIKNKYNGDQTCEHVSFHRGMRMFINPAFISG
jgi:glycosyltransferase involved in cell wall biosynthesis